MALDAGPELTVVHAAARRETWLAALVATPGEPIALDLGGVQEIDSAGVQLVLALQRHAAAGGRALACSAASAEVRAAFETFGLALPAPAAGDAR
ncbi:MAG: STAS domain-containing protein [Rubrivivax sp.]|jgi:ABC-type transporter Mla MlaB component|nr:STAS domain-containing protein [Rubrivivax sp.]